MRRLKIALLSRWYAEEHRRSGGKGTVQELAEAVAALGHEVVVLSQSAEVDQLAPSPLGTIGKLEVWLSPRTRRRSGWTSLRDRWAKRRYGHRKVYSDALDLSMFLKTRGPFDVLWAQCEEPDGLVAAIAAEEGVRLPPTLTQVYALRYEFIAGQPVPRGRAALSAAFAQAGRILANSEWVADGPLLLYRRAGLNLQQLQAKTRIVSHNLQSEFLSAALTEGPAPEPGRVLFLGALNEKKGALVFMDALPQVCSLGVSFAVVGGFTEKNPSFARAWETGLERVAAPIEMLGKVPTAEIITQIRRASVVVLPSLFDEFSRALVEALVLGRPVITTGSVGAAIFVQKSGAGIVVPPGDSLALAKAIDAVLSDPESYARQARELAPRLARELSPEAIALQIEHHLSQIVA